MSLYKFTHIKNEPNQNKKVANNQPKKKEKKRTITQIYEKIKIMPRKERSQI